MSADERRSLPSVSSLLESVRIRSLLEHEPRSVVVDAIRRTIDDARSLPAAAPRTDDGWADAVASAIADATRPSLRRVINGTGVVLHTNLGRAPLASAAVEAVTHVASGFSNLELDMETGERGSRYTHCASLLRELTGAEDALVVNNCAAAIVLVLNTFAEGLDAVVSRGELIEIGGSFRIPEIMEKSGARLVEVGTTNRTHPEDYRRARTPSTGIIVKVHRSNFALAGFVADVSVTALATFAADHSIALVHDLGSGLLLALDEFGLRGEPTASDAVRAVSGVPNGVVTMSGDKLLGGPQAGIILGSCEAIARVRTNPLTRSYRVDKLTLAALEATLALYRDPARALREIPALAQLTCDVTSLRRRAEHVARALSDEQALVSIVDSEATVGGGAFPTARIPSVALAIAGAATTLQDVLRSGDPPLVARVADGRLLIDMRTVLPTEDADVVTAILGIVRSGGRAPES